MNASLQDNDANDTLPPAKQRRRLYDVASKWHCTILGTCLSMGELRSVAAKANIRFTKPDASDYEIHASMVHVASADRAVAKLMHKLLDRKFVLAVKRFSKATTTADVANLWEGAMCRGEVAGALWAAMTHPLADDDLQARIFGEMHMLSHQVGSEARASLRHMHVLENENRELENRTQSLQERLMVEIGSRDKTIVSLQKKLEKELAENRRLCRACDVIERLPTLQSALHAMQEQLELTDLRLRLAEQRAETVEAQSRERGKKIEILLGELSELKTENQTLEINLLESLSASNQPGCSLDCGRPDLCGRCILYVGGRAAQLPHLKRLVEECNGTFVHHDGGLEESVARLDGLLGKADAVMFPIDCISHTAHDKLKILCRRWEKPFVPVRCSGLGAFMRALDTVGKPQDAAELAQ